MDEGASDDTCGEIRGVWRGHYAKMGSMEIGRGREWITSLPLYLWNAVSMRGFTLGCKFLGISSRSIRLKHLSFFRFFQFFIVIFRS